MTVLTQLRIMTAEAHQKLEDQMAIEQRITERASYRALLEDFHGFIRPLEQKLQAVPSWLAAVGDWAARRKTGWLEADLRALGLSEAEVRDLPQCEDLPPAGNLNEALGCAYVIEGSTLGGLQITRLLEKSAMPPEARNYFRSYGAEVRPRWREFCEMLEKTATDERQTGEAAKRTFETLEHWFNRRVSA